MRVDIGPALFSMVLLIAGCSDASDGMPEATTEPLRPAIDNSGQRVWADANWQELFRVGGGVNDTLFQMPAQMAANEGGLTLIDVYAQSIMRFSRHGGLEWSFGRSGRGPEEFSHPMDIALDAEGAAWVLDTENRRITVIGPTGQAMRRVRIPQEINSPAGLVPVEGGGALLVDRGGQHSLFWLRRNGTIARSAPFPWRGFEDLNPLARQVLIAHDRDGPTVVIAFQLGNGLLVLPAGAESDPVRASFVETTPWPTVSVSGDESRRVSSVDEHTFSARSLAVADGCVFVHFRGASERRGRILDVYSPAGVYTRSYELPRYVDRLTVADGVVYAEFSDPAPTLIAWQSPAVGADSACE